MTPLDRFGHVARRLHPGAWWVWALGLATMTARTTNPLLLLLIVAVATLVVTTCRADTPWGRSFRAYLVLGVWIVGVRILFRIVFGGGFGETVLFSLPEVVLPAWASGITVGGPVTLEAILAAGYDGLRLATIVVCFGAANALADPKRLLRLIPRALHDVGTAIVVAMSLIPQLFASGVRIRRARQLRGPTGAKGPSARSLAIPVFEEAMERSLALAAAMESRGYGRSEVTRHTASPLLFSGLIGVCLGLYGLLAGGGTPPGLAAAVTGVGLVLGGAGLRVAGRSVTRSVYRPDVWGGLEWVVAATATATVLASVVVSPASLHPSLQPLAWPSLPLLPAVAVLVAALPALVVAPPPTAPAQVLRVEQGVSG